MNGKWKQPINGGGQQHQHKSSKFENAMMKMAAANSAMVEMLKTGKGSSKGGGKGNSGKGSGKGATCPPCDQQQWPCPWAGCPWATEGKLNLPFRKRCGGCSILRTDKPTAAQRHATQITSPSVSLKTEAAKKKAEESKTKAAAAAAAAEQKAAEFKLKSTAAASQEQQTGNGQLAAGTDPPSLAASTKANKGVISIGSSSDEVMNDSNAPRTPPHIQAAATPPPPEEGPAGATNKKQQRKPITLDPDLWKDIPAIQPVVDALVVSMAFDLMPTEAPLKAAEEWVAELLSEQPACQHSAKRTAVAAQLEGAHSALTGLAGKDPELTASINTRILALTGELEALDKKLPSQRKCTASITDAKKDFNDRHAAALETCQRAKEAHLQRWTGRRQLTQKARELMDVLDAEMEKEELLYEDAHEARNTSREEIAAEVNRLLGLRLEQAEGDSEPAATAQDSSASPAQPTAPKNTELDEALRAANKATEELRKATEQLDQLRAEAERLKKENEEMNAKKAQEVAAGDQLAAQRIQQQQHVALTKQEEEAAAAATAAATQATTEEARLQAEYVAWLTKEAQRVEEINVNPIELPDVDEPPEEMLPVLAQAQNLAQLAALQPKDFLVTWGDLALPMEALELLLGPIFSKLYRDEKGAAVQVPQHVPRKTMGLLGIALSHLAKRLKGLDTCILEAARQKASDSFTAATSASLASGKAKPY